MHDLHDYRASEPRTQTQLDALGGLIRRRILPSLKPTEPLPVGSILRTAQAHGLPTATDEVVPFRSYLARHMPSDSVWASTSITRRGVVLLAFCGDAWDELRTKEPRTAFSAVHELSHAILHIEDLRRHLTIPHGPPGFQRPSPDWCIETQANRLAGALLAPSEGLSAMARRGDLTAESVAARYRVSLRAAKRRISELHG